MRECIFCGAIKLSRGNNNQTGACKTCWGRIRAKILKINQWRKERGLKPLKLK